MKRNHHIDLALIVVACSAGWASLIGLATGTAPLAYTGLIVGMAATTGLLSRASRTLCACERMLILPREEAYECPDGSIHGRDECSEVYGRTVTRDA